MKANGVVSVLPIAALALLPSMSSAEWAQEKSSFPRTRGGRSRMQTAYSGSSRTESCAGPEFKLTIDEKEIRVAGIEGPARLVVSHPDKIEPIFEKEVVGQVGTPISIPLSALDLAQGTTYQAFASRLCDLDNPSRNPSAILQFQSSPTSRS